MHMKDYTLTVRQVLENLATLAHSYETVSRGASPTGNYCFSINVADMAASLKAAHVLISQLPYWISVDERLPQPELDVLVSNGVRCGVAQFAWGDVSDVDRQEWHGTAIVPTHWMPLPEPPEAE